MKVLIFKLKELQAKYSVSGKDLAAHLDVVPSVVSDWRSGKKSPSLQRVDEILDAILELGDQQRLEIAPLSLKDLVEWKTTKKIKSK